MFENFISILNGILIFLEKISPIDIVLLVKHADMFFEGLVNTLLLLIIPIIVGGAIAIPLAIARAYKTPYINSAIYMFIYVIRGTPSLVHLYLIYYGASQFEVVRDSFLWTFLKDPWWCAIIAFSVGTSAYTAEILRGAIVAVPNGEIEAARSCGMSFRLVLKRIVLPNAFRRALPAYSNEIIFSLHTTVLASTITIIDILGAGRKFNGEYYLAFDGYIAAAIMYFFIVLTITTVFKVVEHRWSKHLRFL